MWAHMFAYIWTHTVCVRMWVRMYVGTYVYGIWDKGYACIHMHVCAYRCPKWCEESSSISSTLFIEAESLDQPQSLLIRLVLLAACSGHLCLCSPRLEWQVSIFLTFAWVHGICVSILSLLEQALYSVSCLPRPCHHPLNHLNFQSFYYGLRAFKVTLYMFLWTKPTNLTHILESVIHAGMW